MKYADILLLLYMRLAGLFLRVCCQVSNVLSHVYGCIARRILDWIIGFIDTSFTTLRITHSLQPNPSTLTAEVSPHSRSPSFSHQGQSQSHIATDSHSVCLSWCRAPSGAHDQILVTVLSLKGGRSIWREGGSVFCLSLSSVISQSSV
jgi:hypothetical protein